MAYYRSNYNISTPSTVAWVGKGLTNNPRTDQLRIPLMQSKNQLIDFVYGKYHLQNSQLLSLNKLQEDIISDEAIFNKANKSFNQFKNMNSQFFQTKKLMPDSVTINFMKKTQSKF